MSWISKEVQISNKSYLAQMQGSSFSIPAVVELISGDIIECEKKYYEVTKVTNIANRGEVLLVETKEKEDDKSSKGRTRNNTRGSSSESEGELGSDNEGGDQS
jgi:hypothetical protein